MTVLTAAVSGVKPLTKTMIRIKPLSEVRPVTATLEYPAILDIAFIKKLDMTSFTKKGLITISKICGISFIKRKEDKNTRKRLKRQAIERVKKEGRKKFIRAEPSEEKANAIVAKTKWMTPKTVPKIKVPEVSVDRAKMASKSIGRGTRTKDSKPSVDDILYGPIEISVIEPCKTCGRSEYPERFHSHPRQVSLKKQQQKGNAPASGRQIQVPAEKKLEPPTVSAKSRRHSTGHLQSECASKLHAVDIEVSFHSDHEIDVKKVLPETKAFRQISSSIKIGASQKPKEKKDPWGEASEANTPAKTVAQTKKTAPSPKDKTSDNSSQDDINYVTGCYVCRKLMSREERVSHEEECIAEWRKQNHKLPPDERKAEPVRSDFSFSGSGDEDVEGVFNSVWANHMESLVPCVKCNRTFFPDRIKRHEACCNERVSKQKHTTPRYKLNKLIVT